MACRTRVSDPGLVLTLMVLADSAEGCAAVDVDSGALVRARFEEAAEVPLAPFDLVRAVIAVEAEVPDPTQPEAVGFAGPPEVVGRVRGRRARRLLGPLLLPPAQQPLGFPGSAAPYWSLPGDRPSTAVLAPQRGPALYRRPTGVACRFRWNGADLELPIADRTVRRLVDAGPWARLTGGSLMRALGFTPRHLVVSLSAPQDGRCYKVVTGLLPTP